MGLADCLPALPPIPTHAVEKIEKGVFIDFKELLSDSIAQVSQLHELSHSFFLMQLSGHMRDITDPLSWVYFFVIRGCISGGSKDPRTNGIF